MSPILTDHFSHHFLQQDRLGVAITSSRLSTLPPEIYLEIFSHLDACGSVYFGLTCKQFYAIHKGRQPKTSLPSRTKYLANDGTIDPLVLGQDLLVMSQDAYTDFCRLERLGLPLPTQFAEPSKYVYLFQLLKHWMGVAMTDTEYLSYRERVETSEKFAHDLESLMEFQKIVELYIEVTVHSGQGCTRIDRLDLNPPIRGFSSIIVRKEMTEKDIDDLKNWTCRLVEDSGFPKVAGRDRA